MIDPFIPFRFWELSLGGMIALFHKKLKKVVHKVETALSFVSFFIILVILCIGLVNYDISKIGVATTIIGADSVASSNLILPNNLLLISMVIATCVFLYSCNSEASIFKKSRILSAIGKRSFSIFVWHQVILALYRYSVASNVSIVFVINSTIYFSSLKYKILEYLILLKLL